jgi:hypothetical protein
MKITLTKRYSLSGYGRSRSALVGVKVNAEGALPWSAPACSDIPLAGAPYQQTKAECLVHVTEAEMPYAMNISHHSIYSIAFLFLLILQGYQWVFLLVLQGYQWAIDEVAVSWRHPLEKDTASSFVSFSRLLS